MSSEEPATAPAPAAVDLALWGASRRAWWFSSRFGQRYVDYLLKFRTANALPDAFRARFRAMRIPESTIDTALGEVHRLEDWVGAWNRAAQRFLADARRHDAAAQWQEAAVSRRNAAMCYHIAHLITDDDPRTVRALRAAGVQAFSQAISRLWLNTRKLAIPWRTRALPAYLAKPPGNYESVPVVVLLNGATTTKEELLLWSEPLLERGMAVLAIDWPGTGEAADGTPLSSHCDDITDGLWAVLENEPGIDADRMALLGVSLGGAIALRATILDRRVRACVVVTAPYDPPVWSHRLNPIVARQLMSLAGQAAAAETLLRDFTVADVIHRLRSPLLVVGGAKDLVIPPDESLALAAAGGDLATLVWYPEGGHGLYDVVDDWMAVTGDWLGTVFGLPGFVQPADGDTPSTRVEPIGSIDEGVNWDTVIQPPAADTSAPEAAVLLIVDDDVRDETFLHPTPVVIDPDRAVPSPAAPSLLEEARQALATEPPDIPPAEPEPETAGGGWIARLLAEVSDPALLPEEGEDAADQQDANTHGEGDAPAPVEEGEVPEVHPEEPGHQRANGEHDPNDGEDAGSDI